MDKKNPIITNFDLKIIADYFKELNRQGPGADEQTEKALSFIPELSSMKRIADIGCGAGAQTRVLATHTEAEIIANDLLPEMIEELNRRMARLGLENRVKTILTSMTNLPFEDESLDLIWAEGSIYNIGFEKGFAEWKRFLKKGGYIAVSECCWSRTTGLLFGKLSGNQPDFRENRYYRTTGIQTGGSFYPTRILLDGQLLFAYDGIYGYIPEAAPQ